MIVGTWFGAGFLGSAGRMVVLIATLPLWLLVGGWLPWPAMAVMAAMIALISARAAQSTPDGARPTVVGGTAAALCLALIPARPGLTETVTALVTVGVLVMVRPQWLRTIDSTATVAVGD